jgi:hypothetical protein
VQRFVTEVWQAHFPRSPLMPSTYSIDAAKLDRLEQAIARFARMPGGIDALFDEINHRIGPGGESEITAFRAKLQADCRQSNRKWQNTVIPYLAGTIEGIHQQAQEGANHGAAIHRGKANNRSHQGYAGREIRPPAGRHLPEHPRTDYTPGVGSLE